MHPNCQHSSLTQPFCVFLLVAINILQTVPHIQLLWDWIKLESAQGLDDPSCSCERLVPCVQLSKLQNMLFTLFPPLIIITSPNYIPLPLPSLLISQSLTTQLNLSLPPSPCICALKIFSHYQTCFPPSQNPKNTRCLPHFQHMNAAELAVQAWHRYTYLGPLVRSGRLSLKN